MNEARSTVNIPDIIVGALLLILIPLLTFAYLKQSGDDQPQIPTPNGKGLIPITVPELDERKDEYARIYQQNARLFLTRGDYDTGQRQAQEYRWARSTLERAKKGFSDLFAMAKAAPASYEMEARLVELHDWIRKIEADLRRLPQ